MNSYLPLSSSSVDRGSPHQARSIFMNLWKTLWSWKKTARTTGLQRAKKRKFRTGLGMLENRLTPTAASLAGTVFRDLTGNGLSADDVGKSAVTVKVYRDGNNNGVFDNPDPFVASMPSNLTGGYSFGNLAANRYF